MPNHKPGEEKKVVKPKDAPKEDTKIKAIKNVKKNQTKENAPAQVDDKAEPKGINDIGISPDQFILEKNESIYQTYSMREKLGEGKFLKFKNPIGSFGIVYKAVHKITQEKRAIKFIDRSAVTPEEEAKLMQEIAILRQLVYFALGVENMLK